MSQRPYRQTARANSVSETRKRIVLAFWDYAQTRWFDDITLENVAARAGVTGRTVIRQFGGKEGLVAALADYVGLKATTGSGAAVEDIDMAVDRILRLHEERGDATLRILAQQMRHPSLSAILALHQDDRIARVKDMFAPWLRHLPPERLQTVLDALVIATDVYAWKRLRRDMGRTQGETGVVFRALVKAILGQAQVAAPA